MSNDKKEVTNLLFTLSEFRPNNLVLIECSDCQYPAIARLGKEIIKAINFTDQILNDLDAKSPSLIAKTFMLINPLGELTPVQCKKCQRNLTVVKITNGEQKTFFLGYPDNHLP